MKVWEITALQKTLKSALKAKGLNYRDVAEELKVSEVTVKRLFVSEDPSLKRLTEVCGLIDVSLFDLTSISRDQRQRDYVFTEDQELAFVADERLYYLLIELFNKDMDAIQKEFELTRSYLLKSLRKLERLDLVEIHSDDRIKMLVEGSITWRKNGPLQNKFMLSRHQEYAEEFTKTRKMLTTYIASTEGRLSADSLQSMANELKITVEKYQQIAAREKQVLSADKLLPIAWIVGLGKFKRNVSKIINPN